jgi:hypothetical protein
MRFVVPERAGRAGVLRAHAQPLEMTTLDQAAKARSETAFGLEDDPFLLGKSAVQRRPRNQSPCVQDLPQPRAGLTLIVQRLVDFRRRDKTFLDQQLTQRRF